MNRRIQGFVLLTAAAALACWRFAGWGVTAAETGAQWNALAAFAILAFVSEGSYLRFRVGRGETSASVAFIPTIAAILLFDTGWAMLIAAAAELGVEFAVRKKPAIKIVFNVSQYALAVFAASIVYQALGASPSLDSFRLAPVAVGASIAAYFLVNNSAVSLAVALGDGIPLNAAWSRIAGASLAYDLFSSLLAPLLAFLYVKLQIPGILVLVLPLYFVRHLYHVTLQLEQVNRDLLELMVKAIEARDPYTSGHSLRVSQIAGQIAKDMGLGHKLVEHITTAALLHDVGKIHEEYAPLLRKESKLDPTEKALMQTHPTRSAELVRTISAFRGAIEEAVRHHHENYDGTGYPLGLSGKAIPIGARIIMIADTMDAMSTDRPYRKALSHERVLEEFTKYAGRQFDPELVSRVTRSPGIRELVSARVAAQRSAVVEPAERVGPPTRRAAADRAAAPR